MRFAAAMLAYYHRLGHRVGDYLLPGLAPGEVRDTFSKFRENLHPLARPMYPTRLPESLVAMYAWRNGTRHDEVARLGNLHFVPGFYLEPLEEALASWEIVTEAVEDSQLYENRNVMFRGTSIFPFMHDAMGNHVIIDVGEDSPTLGSVGQFSVAGDSSRRDEFSTLSIFFKAHYECCKAGLYKLDEQGYLSEDWRESEALLQAFRTASR